VSAEIRLALTLRPSRIPSANVSEVAFVITDLFEVFSPKAFKGMRGSTPLTRHFAAQGFKIKLRADGTLGKMWVWRRKAVDFSDV
jgi:hypothetical protein